MLECELSLVEDFKLPPEYEEKPRQVIVFDERLSDVVDLAPFILLRWIRQEGDFTWQDSIWRKVNKRVVWRAPDSMKLGFDEHPRPLPERPASDHSSAFGFNLFVHDRKALSLWPIKPRAV